MRLNPPLPWPLKLTAWWLLGQGALSLAGTTLSILQHRLSIDVSIGSLVLGFGLLALNRPAHWLTLASLALQILMCGWVLRSLAGGANHIGDSRIFSYLLFEATDTAMAWTVGGLMLLLSAQFIYLALPGTRRLFQAGPQA